jgi:hypothetical protein
VDWNRPARSCTGVRLRAIVCGRSCAGHHRQARIRWNARLCLLRFAVVEQVHWNTTCTMHRCASMCMHGRCIRPVARVSVQVCACIGPVTRVSARWSSTSPHLSSAAATVPPHEVTTLPFAATFSSRLGRACGTSVSTTRQPNSPATIPTNPQPAPTSSTDDSCFGEPAGSPFSDDACGTRAVLAARAPKAGPVPFFWGEGVRLLPFSTK